MSLADKLNPGRIKTSGKFTAMLAYILGEHGWTRPEITGMVIDSSDGLLVADDDDPLFDQFVGTGSDLFRNLRGVAKAAGLTKAETAELIRLAKQKTRVH